MACSFPELPGIGRGLLKRFSVGPSDAQGCLFGSALNDLVSLCHGNNSGQVNLSIFHANIQRWQPLIRLPRHLVKYIALREPLTGPCLCWWIPIVPHAQLLGRSGSVGSAKPWADLSATVIHHRSSAIGCFASTASLLGNCLIPQTWRTDSLIFDALGHVWKAF